MKSKEFKNVYLLRDAFSSDPECYKQLVFNPRLHLIEKSAYDKAIQALKTLQVAVNDKVPDPGATAFIERTLKDLGEL